MRRILLMFVMFCPTLAMSAWEHYGENLATNDFFWGSVLKDGRVPWVTGRGLVSQGPWYVDVNHRESALLVGPLAIWTNSPNGIRGVPDLNKAKLEIDIEFEYGGSWHNEYDVRKGGQVVFWFQAKLPVGLAGYGTSMPERIVNYAFNRNFLAEATADKPVTLELTDSLNDWTCLGRNQLDVRADIGSAAKHTCALNQSEFRRALQTPINMGILFLLPRNREDGSAIWWLNSNFPERTLTMGKSMFTLKRFSINRSW